MLCVRVFGLPLPLPVFGLPLPAAGVVREVYQGKATSFTCTGLKPAAEYVLSVKVTYDDGSTLWSDSRAYRTKML